MSRPLSPGGPPSLAPALPRRANTRLHGRYLLLTRLAWAAVAMLTVVCILVSIPAEFAQLQRVCTTGACHPAALTPANVRELGEMGLSVGFYAGYLIAVELIFAITSLAVGVLVFWRKSDELMALFLALLLVTLAGAALSRGLGAFADEPAAVRLVVSFVSFLGNTSLVVFSISSLTGASCHAGRGR